MNDKKGGMIAEAAIVFPVVIAAVMAVVYILIAMYLDASYSARDHLALRDEAGIAAGNVKRTERYGDFTPEDKFGRRPFGEPAGVAKGYKFPDVLLFTDRGSAYVIDEEEYIRKVDLLRGLGEEIRGREAGPSV